MTYTHFLWQKGVMTDLNSLIAPGSGFTLQDAASISDTGYIVGSGIDAAGQTQAFLLSPIPVPEASTPVSFALLPALGGTVLAARKKAQKRNS